MIERRVAFLTEYQNAAYAARYAARVERVREAEAACCRARPALTEAVARALFKLMAYKDEYEVARLYTETDFLKRVADQFEGPYELHFHLAPPLLADRDPETGHLRKRSYGPWMLSVFRILAKLRRLRGTPFDIFGRSEERRTERRLIGEYEAVLDEILSRLSPANHAVGSRARRIAARNPRLRPCQGGQSGAGQSKRSGAPRPLPLAVAAHALAAE